MPTTDELETRIAALEARLAAAPRANPPIVIGELADVPAPGSPIASAWAQEVSSRVVQRFANAAALNAYAGPAGAFATLAGTGRLFARAGTAWLCMTMTSLTKASDVNGFVSCTAAEIGFAKVTFVVGQILSDAANNNFFTGWKIAADGTTFSTKVLYVPNAGGPLTQAGNGTPVNIQLVALGQA